MGTNLEAALAAKRAYQKEWRKKNPEKVKAASERYWARRAEREAAAQETEDQKEVQDNG